MKKTNQDKKKSIYRILGWSIIGIICSVIIPIAINFAYKIPASHSFLEMSWEAKDVLGFYGSLLGAAATIFVLRETILFTRENQKEERKLSIKPYLETNQYHYNKIEDIPSDNVMFLDIEKTLITYYDKMPEQIINMFEEQKRILNDIEVETIDKTVFEYALETFFNKKHVMLYEIENCGAGNAVNVEMQIGDFTIIPNFSISTTKPKKFVFILNDSLLQNNKCVIDISITYSDVSSVGRYNQKEKFTFQRNSKGELQTVQFQNDLLTSPIELEK